MLHIFMTAVNAVFPIVLLILVGYFLRSKGVLDDGFLRKGNALVFKLCLPCMLFVNVYEINDVSDVPWDVVIYCGLAVAVLFLIGMAVAVLTTRLPERRGVIWQCCFRSNYAIIGIPLATALGGQEAAAVSTIVATLVIPFFNIFAVIALSVFAGDGSGKRPGAKKILRGIITNPLIIAVLIGLTVLGLRALQTACFGRVIFSLSRDTEFLYSAVRSLKNVTTPLALLVLGGQFRFSVVKGLFREIAVGTCFRVLAAPVLGIGAALLLDRFAGIVSCTPDTVPAMLALFGSPVAVSSAVMASQMGGDEQLATQFVVWTSICSVVTVFALVCVLMSAGLLAV